MKKVAKLVCVSLMTRVVVDENATDAEIVEASKDRFIAVINQDLHENLESIEDDEQVPFGDAIDDIMVSPDSTTETFKVSLFGNDYVCVDFFCTDRNVSGVDISLNDEHIGEIIGISIPDLEDGEEVEKFNKEVEDWIVDNDK